MFSESYPVKILHTVRSRLGRLVLALWVQCLWLPAETRFHHVHLNTRDPEAAHQYFCQRFPGKAGRMLDQVPGVDTGNGWIVAERREEVKPGQTALWHLGWGAADFRAEYIRHLDAGTRFGHPFEQLRPSLYFAYATGPEGLEVELNSAQRDGFGHIHLYSAHPVVAGEWYQRLGLKATRPLEDKPIELGRYTIAASAWLDAGGLGVIIFPKPEGTDLVASDGTVVDHLAFVVDNLDRKMVELRRSGTRILQEARPGPPGVRTALVQGPDRMKIELLELK